MADQVEIKLATADDAPAVLDFLRQAATETDAVLIPHLDQVTVDAGRPADRHCDGHGTG